jgi:pilus assembly protein CpaE
MQQLPNVFLIDEAPTGQGFDRQLFAAACNVVGVYGYGQQTLEHLGRSDYDVVVVTVREPLARALRAVEMAALGSNGRPVVTYIENLASAPYRLMRQVLRAGASDVFSEPIRPNEIVEVLTRANIVARERRALKEAQAVLPGDVTIVLGAKGGTGKTTLALNLAYGHATLSSDRIVLVDVDPQLGGVPALLDPAKFRPMAPTQLDFLDEQTVNLLQSHDVYSYGPLTIVRLGEASEEDEADQNRIARLLRELSRAFDYTYVDTPSPWTSDVQEALPAANLILFTVIPDLSTIVNARPVLTTGRQAPLFNDKTKVVVNRANMPNALRKESIEEGLGLPVIWQIPTDPAFVQAAQLGVPVVESLPKSQAAQRTLELLYAISGAEKQKSQPGLLGRIVSRRNGHGE